MEGRQHDGKITMFLLEFISYCTLQFRGQEPNRSPRCVDSQLDEEFGQLYDQRQRLLAFSPIAHYFKEISHIDDAIAIGVCGRI